MEAKVDLHVHSKYSDRPSEWFLRRIGAPESFIEPADLYRTCRDRGMDFVTLSDHNTIDGALEIAHLPGTFLSVEATTYFPEDGCKIHCLIFGITEKWFREIQVARENIYDLRAWLMANDVPHAIAHPLFRVNDKLTVEHFEKLLVMFNRFEGLNGSRYPRAGDLATVVIENLTPELIEQLAHRHGIEPHGPTPWKKSLTGGSDDHSGLYSAGAFTVTPEAPTVFDFLHHLHDGRHRPGGRAGTSVRLAHSLYRIAYNYYSRRLAKPGKHGHDLIGALLRRLSEGSAPPRSTGLRATLRKPLVRLAYQRQRKKLSDIERMLADEFTRIREAMQKADEDRLAEGKEPEDEDARNFRRACLVGHQLAWAFSQQFIARMQEGSLIESLQALSSFGPVALALTPYFTAFGAQHKDERVLQSIAERFPGASSMRQRTGKRAWLTDTFHDINGVAHTIRTLAGLAHESGRPITVVTCLPEKVSEPFPCRSFDPVGTFPLPAYESQQVVFPPILEMLNVFEEEGFDELILSTPGPVGLVGLLAGRLLGLRVKGIYHTDFPRYIKSFTDDDAMQELAWRYMQWFYGGMERVFAPSQFYVDQLVERGFDASRMAVLTRGVDRDLFTPSRRDEAPWARFGLNGGFKYLYVGRVSKEKNLESLMQAFERVRQADADTQLVIVGDGPHLGELKAAYRQPGLTFTGYLHGKELAAAYAGSDVFVFPSTTDTFGNAVLEAHACGIPAIVSREGGPPEIVASHDSGVAVETRSPEALAEAMLALKRDRTLYARLREGALKKAAVSRWELALEQLES